MCLCHWLLVSSVSMTTCVQLKRTNYSKRNRSKTYLFYSVTPGFLILVLATLTFPLCILSSLLVLQYSNGKQPYPSQPLFQAVFSLLSCSSQFLLPSASTYISLSQSRRKSFSEMGSCTGWCRHHQNISNRDPKLGLINLPSHCPWWELHRKIPEEQGSYCLKFCITFMV